MFWILADIFERSQQPLTCNGIPFGRLHFLSVLFGFSSVLEAFQFCMHQVFVELQGIEAIMDDNLLWGKTKEDHDLNFYGALLQCQEAISS